MISLRKKSKREREDAKAESSPNHDNRHNRRQDTKGQEERNKGRAMIRASTTDAGPHKEEEAKGLWRQSQKDARPRSPT